MRISKLFSRSGPKTEQLPPVQPTISPELLAQIRRELTEEDLGRQLSPYSNLRQENHWRRIRGIPLRE